MNGFRSMATLAGLAVTAAVAVYGVSAHAQSEGGYEISKNQTVQVAPAGWVGRKTTDRETRTGNMPETNGNSTTFVLTLGGFARKCPTALGVVAGNFEYSLTSDEVKTTNGETHRTHFANHFTARLEGHVRDDAMLDYIEIEGDLTRERDGASPEHQHVPKLRFRPGEGGAPDTAAMLHSVEITADLSVAVAENMMGLTFVDASLEWLTKDECLEFKFDPSSDTRALGPNASAMVRTVLQTKEGNVPVAGWTWRADPIEAMGQLQPRNEGKAEGDAVTFTYTASSMPRKGNGYTISAISRAGIGYGKWTIADPELRFKFDLTLKQQGEGIDTQIRLVLSETRLIPEDDGAYRGTGNLTGTGYTHADSCSADFDFHGTNKVVARPEDPERTRFRLEFTPNEAQHASTMRCPDVGITLTLQWPIATLIHGPTVKAAILGEQTPVSAAVAIEGLTATINGTAEISLPPPK